MADASFVQTSFLGGEWSGPAQGRFDLKEYRTAMDTCLNSFPVEAGSWNRRPGTQNGGTTRGGNAAKLVPFVFQENAPYDMEFSDGYLRFWNGPQLVVTNDTQTVSSVSAANPAKVATATAHGWATGNTVKFATLGTTAPLLQNRQFLITVTSSTEFTLADAVTNVAIDGATIGAVSVAATVTRVMELTTPYGTGAWPNLRSVQAETSALLLTSSVPPNIVIADTSPSATANATFEINPAVFKDGPYLDPVAGGALLGVSGLTGSISLTVKFPAYVATKMYSKGDFVLSSSVNYKSLVDANLNNTPASSPTFWTAVSPGIAVGPNGFLGTDVGRLIRLFSEPPLWDTATTYAIGNVVAFGGTYWTALSAMNGTTPATGSINPNQPGNLSTTWAVNPNAMLWSWGKITGFSYMVSQTVASVANIGTMTANGGLAAAFDGVIVQNSSASSVFSSGGGSPPTNSNVYLGRHFAGGAQQISSVTLIPSADAGFAGGTPQRIQWFNFNLRAKHTAPANSSDGTLLGTSGQINNNSFVPVSITSSDAATAWEYVWIEITGLNTAYGANGWGLFVAELQYFNPTGTGSGTGITVALLGDDLKYSSDIRSWRLGAYSNTTGWPRCGTYHDGRIWLSGVLGNRIDGCVSNGIVGVNINFAPTAPNGTVADNNAIAYKFNAKDVNTIFWMESEQQGIICGTQAGEWLVQATTQNPTLTPTNIKANRVTKVGCANVEPQHAETTLLVVQRYKHKLVEYFADVFSGKFSAPNLSLYADHLSTRGIEEIAYQQTLSPILWCRCTDGSLIGMSYKRESLASSQGPAFFGWHRHVLGSGRVLESLRTASSAVGYQTAAGVLDTIAMITNDTGTNIRHVEFLTNIFEDTTPGPSAWFADDAVNPSSYVEATVGGKLGLNLNGLWHLNGSTVAVFANGVDQGDFLVTNGTCFIPYTATLTQAVVAAFAGAMQVVVGFTYTSRGRIVSPAGQAESGARNGPGFGKVRRIHHLAALLTSAAGMAFGTIFGATPTKLNAALFRHRGGAGDVYVPGLLFSGVYWITLKDDSSLDGKIGWEITRPYPAIVSVISGFLQTEDQ